MFGKNIKYLRTQKGLSQMKLAEIMGVKRTSLSGYELGNIEPNMENLVKFAKFFGTTVDELITQDLTQKQPDKRTFSPTRPLQVLAVSVDKNDNEFIDFVPVSAKAGYSSDYANPEFVSELFHFSLPKLPPGTYRAFEISGDSMLPLNSGSVVIGRFVEKITDIKDGQTAIVVTATDGVVYKRVYRNDDFKTLTLQSDNSAYEPYRIDYLDVLEVWSFYASITFDDGVQQTSNSVESLPTPVLYKIAHDVGEIKRFLGY